MLAVATSVCLVRSRSCAPTLHSSRHGSPSAPAFVQLSLAANERLSSYPSRRTVDGSRERGSHEILDRCSSCLSSSRRVHEYGLARGGPVFHFRHAGSVPGARYQHREHRGTIGRRLPQPDGGPARRHAPTARQPTLWSCGESVAANQLQRRATRRRNVRYAPTGRRSRRASAFRCSLSGRDTPDILRTGR